MILLASIVALVASDTLLGQSGGEKPGPSGTVASIHLVKQTVQVGQPIWVDFTICNPTDQPIRLGLVDPDLDVEFVGATALPLEHVFSGPGLRSLRIVGGSDNAEVEGSKRAQFDTAATSITLDPMGILGTRIDVAEYFPGLQSTGTFYLTWAPYGGQMVSARAKLTLQQLKQAVLETSLGDITMAFEYEAAPQHVANFIGLAETGFYDNKTFHMVVPGALVHGGCPRGDGTGVRPDGKTINAEFSDLPHRVGTVSMSRKANDPDSASCQFFISLTRLSELDGQYTVFGRVVGQDSFDTLQQFSTVETDDRDRPIDTILIRRVRIENSTYRPTTRIR